MKSTIGVYDSHHKAVQAVKTLKENGFSDKKISLLGQAEMKDDHLHAKNETSIPLTEASIGVVAGSILGVLTGLGVFAIPGLGFLYGAGALVGAFAGFDFGVIGGGLVSIFTSMGMESNDASEYERYVKEGKTLVIIEGDEAEVKRAGDVLRSQNTHVALNTH